MSSAAEAPRRGGSVASHHRGRPGPVRSCRPCGRGIPVRIVTFTIRDGDVTQADVFAALAAHGVRFELIHGGINDISGRVFRAPHARTGRTDRMPVAAGNRSAAFELRAPDRGGRPWIGCIDLLPNCGPATFETLYVVSLSLVFGGLAGLLLGPPCTRRVRAACSRTAPCSASSNVVVNFFRPIRFVILLAAAQPIARSVGIPGIGPEFGIFAITLASMFAISRIVVARTCSRCAPASSKAARAAGASSSRILFRLIPARRSGAPSSSVHASSSVALVDMTAIAGAGRRRRPRRVRDRLRVQAVQPGGPWAAVLIIIVIVQGVQFIGNALGPSPPA
jgi:D-methionine transport system permease protein